MEVTFFPSNKLGATIEPIYNGHIGVVSQNTDRMVDGKFALAELNAFKYDIQHTAFLNPFGSNGFPVTNTENINYGDSIRKVHGTGRISFGIYYRTDSWYNPIKQQVEIIPSYNSTTWLQASVDAGFDVTVGATKPIRYPNHGQEMFDESNGVYGFDFNNDVSGSNDLQEIDVMTSEFINYFKGISGLRLTNISYTNGERDAAPMLKPFFVGARNSEYSWNGDSDISYDLTLTQAIDKASSTRTWDAQRAGRFATQQDSIDYSKTQIQRALNSGGWWSDFHHDHSLYNFDDVEFFDLFYSGIRNEVGIQDAWMAGYGEALEYMFLRDSIVNVGSYERDSFVNISIWVRDVGRGESTNGFSDALDMSLLKTPVSVRVDLSGTSLSGKDVKCDKAHSVRKMGADIWIVNIPYSGFGEFGGVQIEEGAQDYYNGNTPILSETGGVVSSDMQCKFVVWRKADSAGIETTIEVDRVNEFSYTLDLEIQSGYTYYVGAISKSNHSSLITVN